MAERSDLHRKWDPDVVRRLKLSGKHPLGDGVFFLGGESFGREFGCR